MASLGELTARAILDIAQFTGPLNKAEKEMAEFGKSIDKTFKEVGSGIGNAMAGMVASVASVGAVMAEFSASLDVQSQIHDISTVTGAAVEELDKLAIVAKLNGSDLGTMQKAMKEVNKTIVEANDPASKSAAIFKELGISAEELGKQAPTEQLKTLTEAFAQYPDDAAKATAMTEIFGKASKDVALIMKNYTNDMETAKEITEKFGGTSKEAAAAADAIGDNIDSLRMGMQHVLIQAFVPLADMTGRLFKAFGELGGQSQGLAKILGDSVSFSVKILASAFIGLFNAISSAMALLKGIADVMSHLGDWEGMKRAALDTGTAILNSSVASGKALEQLWSTDIPKVAEAQTAVTKTTGGLTEAINHNTDKAKESEAAYKKWLAEMQKQAKALDDMTAKWTEFAQASGDKKLEEYNKKVKELSGLIALTAGQMPVFITALALVNEQFAEEKYKEYQKGIADVVKEFERANDVMAKWRDEDDALIETAQKQNATLKIAISQWSMTTKEIELNNVELARNEALTKATDDATKRIINAEYDHQRALVQTRQSQQDATTASQQWVDVLKTFDSYGSDLFTNVLGGIESIGDFAKKAGQDLKKWLLDVLYQATLKPFIISLVGSAAGSAGAATGAGSPLGVAGAAAGNPLGSLISVGGTLATSFGTLATTVGTTAALMADGATAMVALEAGAMTAGLTLAAAVPVIGAIAVAAYLAYQYFSKAGGGPKKGGTYGDALQGLDVFPGETGPEGNQTVKKIITSIDDSYTAILKKLGGHGVANFGLAFDTDPEGTAANRLNAAVLGPDGQPIYQYKSGDTELGRDDAVLSAAMETQAKRMLLAALQASDLGSEVTRVLNSIIASSASTEDIDKILEIANAVNTMAEAIGAMADPVQTATDALADANNTALDNWTLQREALYNMANELPQTSEGIAALAQGMVTLYQSTVQMIAGMMQAKDAMAEMFGTTRESIADAFLTPEQAYAKQKALADDLAAQLAVSTDPDEIAKLAEKYNDAINKAWGLLAPEEQQAHQAEFLASLDSITKIADERMADLIADVATQAQSDRDFMQSTMNAIVDRIEQSSDSFATAAQVISDAAGRPTQVEIKVIDGEVQVNG